MRRCIINFALQFFFTFSAGRKAPRTPNWNASEEHQQQKHWLARQQYMIDDK